ncbi:hypothetical protein GCM10028820_30200 [Tessaracoccus terricola]
MPWVWWLLLVVLVVSLTVAVLAYVPIELGGVVVGLIGVALAVLAFSYGNAAVRVEQGTLTVGRFRIEGEWIASAEALHGEAAATAMAAGADPRDLLHTRPYVKDLVRVRIADPADPHPHWIVSSRRADELAAAITDIAKGDA